MQAEDSYAPGPTTSGGAEAEAAQPHEADNDAVPCRICQVMLNGAQQYRVHLKTRRHRDQYRDQRDQYPDQLNTRRLRVQGLASADGAPACPKSAPATCAGM